HSGILPAQSGLACRLRRRSPGGASDPSQILRYGIGRKGTGGGFPFHLPLDRSCREGWRKIPAGADCLESGDLADVFRAFDMDRPSHGAACFFAVVTAIVKLKRCVSKIAHFMHLHPSADMA